MSLETDCMHHQASLARKPNILALEGLASTLVRFGRTMRATKFQQGIVDAIQSLAERMDRKVVSEMPRSSEQWLASQRTLFDLAGGGAFAEDEKQLIVTMFNGHWQSAREEWQSGSWVHWCNGCCPDLATSKLRALQALKYLFLRFPSEPLLYRWKHWEPFLEQRVLSRALVDFSLGIPLEILAVSSTALSFTPLNLELKTIP